MAVNEVAVTPTPPVVCTFANRLKKIKIVIMNELLKMG